jgi:hypothetical protein
MRHGSLGYCVELCRVRTLSKNLDLIVADAITAEGSGFGL